MRQPRMYMKPPPKKRKRPNTTSRLDDAMAGIGTHKEAEEALEEYKAIEKHKTKLTMPIITLQHLMITIMIVIIILAYRLWRT